ncbi:hypothetical protein J3U99_13740 [Brucella pituitosa]|uniref:hypothetical protein n=1 Tax=Brucella pituitosa TaxID=571256 RepID=UPI000C276579|nr:hypothetical protein [Brucella pituitosa]MCK4205834.1 hypothetical protein [Brucella pituitosa]PJO45992.1 hypothetical protein CWE02_12385 [Brucella pituitosa]PRA88660.1 hypothetical protein CQ054_00505 [Ochrobactrum sp. MYb29]
MNTVSAMSIAKQNSFACCCQCGKRAMLDVGAVWTLQSETLNDAGQLRCRNCSILAGYDALMYR